jgi:hypothetical protein
MLSFELDLNLIFWLHFQAEKNENAIAYRLFILMEKKYA